MDIPALVNDSVGTLACARYGDGIHQTDTSISLIVGTGGYMRCCLEDIRAKPLQGFPVNVGFRVFRPT